MEVEDKTLFAILEQLQCQGRNYVFEAQIPLRKQSYLRIQLPVSKRVSNLTTSHQCSHSSYLRDHLKLVKRDKRWRMKTTYEVVQ